MSKRVYIRKCGQCKERHNQKDMYRVSKEFSNNGWLCENCYCEHLYDNMPPLGDCGDLNEY